MMATAVVALTSVTNKTPMNMLTIIIINSVVASMATFKASMEPWATALLLMVYVSGVMVLFMYIVSLSTMKNPKSKMNSKGATFIVFLMASYSWVSTPLSMKEANKFCFSFEKYLSITLILASLMVIMATIIPKISMINFKGLKASN